MAARTPTRRSGSSGATRGSTTTPPPPRLTLPPSSRGDEGEQQGRDAGRGCRDRESSTQQVNAMMARLINTSGQEPRRYDRGALRMVRGPFGKDLASRTLCQAVRQSTVVFTAPFFSLLDSIALLTGCLLYLVRLSQTHVQGRFRARGEYSSSWTTVLSVNMY